MVKAKAQEVVDALPKNNIPAGVTVTVKEVKEKPETTATGEQKPAKVVIEYTDDKGRVVGSKEVRSSCNSSRFNTKTIGSLRR